MGRVCVLPFAAVCYQGLRTGIEGGGGRWGDGVGCGVRPGESEQ